MIDFNLPESFAEEWNPYVLPKAATRVLVLSDLHIPYQSNIAITAVLRYAKTKPFNTILLNGDILDFHTISRYQHDPRKRSVKQELAAANQFLDVLVTEFPNCKIYYKYGNHDERYEKFIIQKAPELFDIEKIQLHELLNLRTRGIEWIDDQRIVMVGKLPIVHGHEFQGSATSSVNPARGFSLKSRHSIAGSHCHRTSEDCTTDIVGEMHTAWSFACLSELHPGFSRINQWNHGFGDISVFANGDFHVKNKRIYKGVIL